MKRCYFPQLILPFAFLILITSVFSASAAETNPSKTPMEKLIQGNQRYVDSETVCQNDWNSRRVALVEDQAPFAIIVACSDSRVPPELLFDQTLGSIFVVRLAGNVVDDIAIGSIEYAVKPLGANLVVVLGHSNCGAVDAALNGLEFDNHIQNVLDEIKPAITSVKGQSKDSHKLLEIATKANVQNVKKKIMTSQPFLAKSIKDNSLQVIGAYYDLTSGKVEFLDTP